MVKWLLRGVALMVVFGLGALAAARWRQPPQVDSATVLTRMREVARLQALEVTVYRKVALERDPPRSATALGELYQFARQAVAPVRGRAIVFGVAQVGLDLSRLDADHVRVCGDRVEVTLPPLEVRVELLPDETEIISSNLDSAETAQLLALGKATLEREVRADRALQARARAAAERALTALLRTLGFREVVFQPGSAGAASVRRPPRTPPARGRLPG